MLERAAPPGTPGGIAAEAVRNAVRRIPDERLVPFAREVRHSISRLDADGLRRYSVSRNPDARREVEDALAKDADGRYTGRANADIVFSDALPPALIACGIPDGRVYTRGYVLRKLEREHALDADGIMAVSQAMESPAAVLSDAAGGGYIVLTDHETRDEDGRVAPVMVYLRPDGRGNYIASAYARSRRAESQYVNLIRAGNALFVDKRKVATLNLTGEVQSSFESARGGDAGSIPYGGTDSQGGEPRHSVRRDELALHDDAPDPQREYDEVVARFTNEDGTRKPGWMKAPNGEPTNLAERQWVQVRTPAFKRWFGDWEGDPANASKVVDENGEPLVVYHTTPNGDFYDFDTSHGGAYGRGAYVTTNRAVTSYKRHDDWRMMELFVNARNPVDWDHVLTDGELEDVLSKLDGIASVNQADQIGTRYATPRELVEDKWAIGWKEKHPKVGDVTNLNEVLTDRGWAYDGELLDADAVMSKGHRTWTDVAAAHGIPADTEATWYAVTNPEQIKSATENAGAFDPFDTDIRYSVGRAARTAMEEIADGAQSATIENAEVGEIGYPLGAFGEMTDGGRIRHGLGFLHIVYSRMAKDGASLDEAVATAIRVAESAANGEQTRNTGNRIWLDKDGIRAVIARNADGQKVITGYEIYAEEPWTTSRANHGRKRQPTPRLDDVLSALRRSIAYLAPSAQVPDADGFVRDAVMGMLAAANGGKGAANAGGEGARPTPERGSVRRGGSAVRIDDLAIGTLAQRILAGREPTVDDAGKFLAGFGLSRTVNAADALDRARRIADANRERLKADVERANPEVIGTLARANLADSMQSAMDSLVKGTAQAIDPEIGMRLKDAVAARDRRALMAAKGFTAAEMMAKLPVNLAEAVMSVAELERTPEEMARREEERKRREEEKAKKGENEAATADADGYTPASDEIEPTDAQKRMVAELLDRAKFANEQAAREDERRKADAERRRDERRDEGDGDDGSDGDREGMESALPEATVRRIAPVLTDRWLAAQFLIEWIGDEILKAHPEIPATGEMWKSPVAIRELKQTAVHILRRLAKDTLGSPSLNYARNLADHQINELESDVDTRTYRMVRRRIADVYETIHDNALRISRRKLVSRLIDGWREKGVSHPGIRQLTGARGRFSATTEEMKRKIDGRTEVYARKLIPLLTMSEEKLAKREAELERIVTGSPDETTAPDEETMREARDELAALKRFGGLVRRMPGEIADAADDGKGNVNAGKNHADGGPRKSREPRGGLPLLDFACVCRPFG